MDLGLSGRRAIVTGGTRGIGLKIVQLLIAEGCQVGLCARNQDQVTETIVRLTANGGTVVGGAVDVSDDAKLRDWIDDTASTLGGLDILIANASALVSAADVDAWRLAMEVDMLGTVRAVEAAVPFLEKSDAASIVAVSSTAGVNVSGAVRAYGGVKAALIHYMSSLSSSLGAQGIRANTVSPGAIFFEGGVWDERKKNSPDVYDAAVARSPMGRLGTPEEVASAVVFLASPAASFISGTNLIVDGAVTTRVQF